MNHYFITASGTDVGKTLVTTALCWQLRQQGKKVTALKPVATGFSAADEHSDSALILKSCGLTPTPSMIETITPWRYAAYLTPSMAAPQERDQVDFSKLIGYCKDHTNLESDVVLVEGVGGIMAPMTESKTVLDWMKQLRWPVILVGGTYLGSISHTLSSYEALKAHNVQVRAIILSESERSTVPINDTVAALQAFVNPDMPVVKIPRIQSHQELWQHAPLISWLVSDEKYTGVM
ncbi:MAG: dethiobiotin synthase [Alphaproteobacteria bacterium]